MGARPMTTEYRTNFLPPAQNVIGQLPAFYGSAPHRHSINSDLGDIKRRLGNRKLGVHNTLMEQWIKRTKGQHFGAFSESYPNPAPFSTSADTDAKLKLPDIPLAHVYKESEEPPTPEEKFKRTYSVLLKQLKDRKANAQILQTKLPGGGKGAWKHINASYGAGTNLLSWVDASRAGEDAGNTDKRKETEPEKPCGGKGPNRHLIESHGAGANVITWISGFPEREITSRFSTCLPLLPTMHQQEKVGGNHPLVGGQLRRPDVRGLRDWYV